MGERLEQIAALLRSRKTEERIRAVKQLAAQPVSQVQALLLTVLGDKSGYVAGLAARALGEGADETACAQMNARFLYLSEEGLKRDPGCHVRAELAFALGRLDYRWAADALRVGLRTTQIEAVGGVPFDTAAHLRANCALALGQIRAPDALRDITPLLFDIGHNRVGRRPGSPAVTSEPRKAAAQALARLGDRNGLVPLEIKLMFPGGEAVEVLQECMQAVVELQDERALEMLEPYLQHTDTHLAAYAALMLAQTRTAQATDAVVTSLSRFRGDPLRAVLLALTAIRTEESAAALLALEAGERDDIRLLIAELTRARE